MTKFILATKLKVIARHYDIFMLVSTPEEYLMASRWYNKAMPNCPAIRKRLPTK